MPNVMWFRRDCRILDNPALTKACEESSDGVIAVFILTPVTWQGHALGSIQLHFLLENLQMLSDELAKLNIPLLIPTLATFQEIPVWFNQFMRMHAAETLYFNRQYEWDERKRDEAVTLQLSRDGITVRAFDDQVLVPPQQLLNQQGEAYKVFTAYKKQWIAQINRMDLSPLPRPKAVQALKMSADPIPRSLHPWPKTTNIVLPNAGEQAAIKQLRGFAEKQCQHYSAERDFPALDSTSHLSAYLALGVLSPRQCLARILLSFTINDYSLLATKSGPAVWISELIWREFYKMIMWHFPRVCKFQAFQAVTDQLPWRHDQQQFYQWCQGMTGFPLVDAAMRQLNQTGWMHNRLRMLTATFLSKILFIDWRWGEKYFSEKLIDIDFSANNGGWQWCASTGTDAAPYFRIFNPITQSQRFDANGDFIRQFCPELATLDRREIHDPELADKKINYPKKMIDYRKQRQLVLAAFKSKASNESH